MTHRFLVVPLVGVTLLTVGCATKKFVREELGKSEVKVGQEVGRLEGDLGREKTRLSEVAARTTEARSVADEATKRADKATGKADEATARAGQALTKADEAAGVAGQALAKADQTDSRLTRLWANRHKRNLGETVLVVFGFDKWQLDDRAQTSLLDVVKQLEQNPTLVVDLEGYTDNVGPGPYNVQLSQRRAEAVRRFLAEKGVELTRIQSIGLGDIRPVADNTTRQGRDQNRRVVLKLFAPAD